MGWLSGSYPASKEALVLSSLVFGKVTAQLAVTDGMRRPVSSGMLYAPKLSTGSKRGKYGLCVRREWR